MSAATAWAWFFAFLAAAGWLLFLIRSQGYDDALDDLRGAQAALDDMARIQAERDEDLQLEIARRVDAEHQAQQARERIEIWECRHAAVQRMLNQHGLYFYDTFDLEDAETPADIRGWSV